METALGIVVLVLSGLAAAAALGALALASRIARRVGSLPSDLSGESEARHRAMITDLHGGLAASADRIASRQSEEGDRLRRALADELERNRNQLQVFERTLQERVDARLADISGKVNERLEEGFRKTNETFVSVMTRLQTIDDAQRKIETLTGSVVSLQQLLGSKSSRGALGERQLEDIVRNMLPESAYEFQYTFRSTNARADCVLKLPEPTGLIAVDSKFPLENYERLTAEGPERASAALFKADVRRHVDAIAGKYIVPGETGEGAVMFIPAEAVFAEIHANHRDLFEYAVQKRVWMVSPTTLAAVLNTARAVLKDTETRRQVHIIKDELGKLGREFGRFDERMRRLAEHIRQANRDVDEVAITSKKISDKFAAIERAELPGEAGPEALAAPGPQLTVVPKSE
ncbi:MAG TPA: DNA recombination protein RmuC [Usitatibacter sp.]|nr:DNA recombination protein RmuC [Usitatibacter sp.]